MSLRFCLSNYIAEDVITEMQTLFKEGKKTSCRTILKIIFLTVIKPVVLLYMETYHLSMEWFLHDETLAIKRTLSCLF